MPATLELESTLTDRYQTTIPRYRPQSSGAEQTRQTSLQHSSRRRSRADSRQYVG